MTKSVNADSNNSCKPSSTDGFKKVVQNNRVKSANKPGRKKGHEKSSREVSSTPNEIVQVSKTNTCTCGGKTEIIEEVSRDLISIEIVVHTTRYTGKKTKCTYCTKVYSPKFPKNVTSTINYDENLKSLVVFLNTYCNVPNQKVVDFLGFLSDDKIKMCHATVQNTISSFSKRSKVTLKDIKKHIISQLVINEDETPISVGGKIMSAIGVFTKKVSIIEAFQNRKLESFKEMGILDKYIGTVCHNHNNIHRAFKSSKQAECNFHILRYCKAELEVHKRKSIEDFMNYMLELRDSVDIKRTSGKKALTEVEYENLKQKHLAYLNIWNEEHKKDYNKNTKKVL